MRCSLVLPQEVELNPTTKKTVLKNFLKRKCFLHQHVNNLRHTGPNQTPILNDLILIFNDQAINNLLYISPLNQVKQATTITKPIIPQ